MSTTPAENSDDPTCRNCGLTLSWMLTEVTVDGERRPEQDTLRASCSCGAAFKQLANPS